MKHPGHTYGGFIPAISERGMTLGMPLDRDIKFVIELKPGTAPIYMIPYRMATLELAELKEHIKELLEKGFIHPS
jgi:hypothetical protein